MSQRKAVNMLGLFPTSPISAAHTFNIHILQEVLKPLGRERCMIRIAKCPEWQNRCCWKTGEWVEREDG